MTTIGMHYDVIPGKEQIFIDAFVKVLEVMQTLPGHGESRLFEDVQRKGSFVLFSQWDNKESFDAFIRSDAFKNTVAWGKAEILKGRPMHKVYMDQ